MKKFFIYFLVLSSLACGSPSNDKLEGSTSTAVGNPNLPAYSVDEEKMLVKAIADGNVTIEAKNDFIELAPVLSIDNVETKFLVNGVVKAEVNGAEFMQGEILFKVSVPANKGDLIVIHVRVPNTIKEDNQLEAIASEVDTTPLVSIENRRPISKINQNSPPPLVEENNQECSATVSCSDGLICYLFHCYTQEEHDALMKTQAGLNQDLTPQQSVQVLKETAATINNQDTQVPLSATESYQIYKSNISIPSGDRVGPLLPKGVSNIYMKRNID